ncbi:anti-sigma B factor antagonist [Prauserella shujinwangii]|uniref:Anti-sigma factor antagonist n=1 Tax=Prauserella shujinwangii TaxID=1453103 RepID=A0A2T0M1D1_9PSEU|nr:STAS domain-containing protein [Prauserella shujinwangii]PRX50377.1 anti-sigma B factor antagonist [Prauserella shujinwangii]
MAVSAVTLPNPDSVLRLDTYQPHPSIAVVSVDGEVDLGTAPQLAARLAEQLAPPPAYLVVDLSQVAFLGAAGLNVLADAARDAAELGTPLRVVVGGQRQIRRLLRLCGLDDALPAFETVDDAVRPIPRPR